MKEIKLTKFKRKLNTYIKKLQKLDDAYADASDWVIDIDINEDGQIVIDMCDMSYEVGFEDTIKLIRDVFDISDPHDFTVSRDE